MRAVLLHELRAGRRPAGAGVPGGRAAGARDALRGGERAGHVGHPPHAHAAHHRRRRRLAPPLAAVRVGGARRALARARRGALHLGLAPRGQWALVRWSEARGHEARAARRCEARARHQLLDGQRRRPTGALRVEEEGTRRPRVLNRSY